MPAPWHYLDHAASSPLRPEARAAMAAALDAGYGNPSGAHALARAGRAALDDARAGAGRARRRRTGRDRVHQRGDRGRQPGGPRGPGGAGGTAVCTAIEHKAVLEPVHASGGRVVPVDQRGLVDLDALAAQLDDTVTLVSVGLVNNEIGTVQPLDDDRGRGAGARTRRRCCTRTPPRRSPGSTSRTSARAADLITLASHKCGGPVGVGALVVRAGVTIAPQQIGGGQERERRSGTQDVASAVAFAAAAAAADRQRSALVERTRAWREAARDGDRHRHPGHARERGAPRIDPRPSRRRHRERVPAGGEQRGAPVRARARPPGAGQRGLELRQRCPGAVARAGGARDRPGAGRPAPCACRWAGRPPRPTSTSPSRPCPPRPPTCRPTLETEPPHDRARARCDVGGRRLVGRGGAPARGRPRGGRRHPQALGRRVRLRLLLGGRCRRCALGRPPARHRAPHVQLRRRLRRARRGALPRGPRGRVARPTRASSATATSSSTGCCAAPTPSASRPWPPATTPGSSSVPTAPAAWRAAPIAAKDQSYVVHMLDQATLARVRFPVGAPRQGRRARRGRPARPRHRRQARQPGRVLHHGHRRPPRPSSSPD